MTLKMTRVENSLRKFKIDNEQVEEYAAEGAEGAVDDVSSSAIGQLVTIHAKVAKVGEVKSVYSKRRERRRCKQLCYWPACHNPCEGCEGGRGEKRVLKKKRKALEEARLYSRRLHVPMPDCFLGREKLPFDQIGRERLRRKKICINDREWSYGGV